jgi:hypothetical protein
VIEVPIRAGAAAILFLAWCRIATAQQSAVTCTVTGEPLTVRAEGIAELVGDLVLSCSGGTPTQAGKPVPRARVQIFLANTNITSRLLSTDLGLSEATLLIDDPAPEQQRLCASLGGICEVTAPFDGTPNVPNVFNAVMAAPNSVMWLGVPFDPPGADKQRMLRITNVRADASKLAASSPIVMSVVVMCSPPVLIATGQQTVAMLQQGLVVDASSGTGTVCLSQNTSLIDNLRADGNGFNFVVSVREGFASSFKTRTVASTPNGPLPPLPLAQNLPGHQYNTESGFYAPDVTLTDAGLADFGTRILLVFNNAGSGVRIFMPVEVALTAAGDAGPSPPRITTGRLTLVATDPYGNSPFVPVMASSAILGVGVAEVKSGYAVYEVVSDDPSAIESASIPVAFAYIGNTGQGLPSPGLTTVNVNLAPVGGPLASIHTTDTTAPIPRFVDVSTPKSVFTIGPCTCNLLFPFVSNESGFDTGVVIANTSLDPYGTAPQSGLVALYFYGTGIGLSNSPCIPKMVTASPVVAGTELIFSLSAGGNYGIQANPGCRGYLIAVANFQYCHGLTIISDAIGPRLGYLALQLDIPGLNRTGIIGENEGH